MKISYLLIAVMFTCCGENEKGTDKEVTDKKENPSENNSASTNIISFKVDGEIVNTGGWLVQRFVWDEKTPAPWLNITSNMHKDKRTINVNLNAAKLGKYSFSENAPLMTSSHGSYFPDFSKPLQSFSFASGEFNITEVDTVTGIVNGTFMGVVKDVNNKTINISEGKLIDVKLNPGVTNLTKGIEEYKK